MKTKQKTLYLVRHAKSSWKDISLADRDRPLNKRGRRSAPDMGRRMARQGYRPDLIISSPANRAFTTAGIIAEQVGYEVSDIIRNEDLYFSGTDHMRRLLEEVDARYQSVMMVGHNPVMTSFMNYLANASVVNMPTCAIAVIGFDIASWADLSSVQGKLLGYDFPKGAGDFKTYLVES
jgi:phosphohistidine phosphatase